MVGHLMRINVFEFTKADFASMPPPDRRMILLGGHALNLLGLGVKLLAVTVNSRSQDATLDSFNAAQAQILLRSICGTLVECWRWINRKESYELIQNEYLRSMPHGAAAAYKALGSMFDRSSVLARARDRFTFHFPKSEHLDEAFIAIPDDQDFNWYVSDENTNSLYFGCEAVIGFGVDNLASEEVDGRAGMVRVMHELTAAANAMSDFLGGLLAEIVDRYLSDRPRSAFNVEFAPGPRPAMPFLLHGVMSPRNPETE